MSPVLRTFIDDDSVDHSAFHPEADALTAAVGHIADAPADDGLVELIVRRPDGGVREELSEATLDVEVGLVGDSWINRPSRRSPDGGPHPDAQITLMNSRVAGAVAGTRDRWALCGDQLYVDLDVSRSNLVPGTRLGLGSAELEVTAEPHTGCAKFSRRFGAESRRFVNSESGRALEMRGINARVVRSGTVALGDRVRKLPNP